MGASSGRSGGGAAGRHGTPEPEVAIMGLGAGGGGGSEKSARSAWRRDWESTYPERPLASMRDQPRLRLRSTTTVPRGRESSGPPGWEGPNS